MPFLGAMPVKLSGAIAGTGLTAATVQYKFVKISADNAVILCTGATDIPIGVIQSPVGATGDPVDVVVVGETMIQADASLTAGNLIGTSSDGQADAKTVATDSTEYVVGAVVNVAGASAAGNLITAVINCANPHRAS
jgi:hypothetical protein